MIDARDLIISWQPDHIVIQATVFVMIASVLAHQVGRRRSMWLGFAMSCVAGLLLGVALHLAYIAGRMSMLQDLYHRGLPMPLNV